MLELKVDASDLEKEIGRLQAAMRPQAFQNAMYGIYRRAGGHVRKVLRTDIPKKYEVRAGQVSSETGSPQLFVGPSGSGCNIPIKGPRRDLGGTRGNGFAAAGGRHGWKINGPYRIRVRIIKGSPAYLPKKMGSGQAPFRNLSAPSLNKLVFARVGQARLPIEKQVGIAIPQMPLNRSREEVQEDIMQFMTKQVERRLMAHVRGFG